MATSREFAPPTPPPPPPRPGEDAADLSFVFDAVEQPPRLPKPRFAFTKGEEVSVAVPRVAHEQIAYAAANILAEGPDKDTRVHEARKTFKRLRALVRLIRDDLGQDVYRLENVTYRDIGRALAGPRDAAVRLATLELLSEDAPHAPFVPLRRRLERLHERLHAELLANDQLETEITVALLAGARRVSDWDLTRGIAPTDSGLERVYRRGRRRLREALSDPSPARLHELRKRVKYLRYQIQLLKAGWPEMLSETVASLDDLGELLGSEHDIADLTHYTNETDVLAGRAELMLAAAADAARRSLWSRIFPMAVRLYAEEPPEFVARIRSYWLAA